MIAAVVASIHPTHVAIMINDRFPGRICRSEVGDPISGARPPKVKVGHSVKVRVVGVSKSETKTTADHGSDDGTNEMIEHVKSEEGKKLSESNKAEKGEGETESEPACDDAEKATEAGESGDICEGGVVSEDIPGREENNEVAKETVEVVSEETAEAEEADDSIKEALPLGVVKNSGVVTEQVIAVTETILFGPHHIIFLSCLFQIHSRFLNVCFLFICVRRRNSSPST